VKNASLQLRSDAFFYALLHLAPPALVIRVSVLTCSQT